MEAKFLSHSLLYKGDYECLLRTPQNELPYQLHYHDFYEIVLYLGNAGIFKINGKEYIIRRGDIALINMFDPHTLVYNKNTYYERFSMSIDPSLLLSFNTPYSNLLDIFTKENSHYPIFHVDGKCFDKYLTLLHQFDQQKPAHGQDIYEKALLHQLASYLYSDCYDGIHFDNTDSRHVAMIAELVDFINTHLDENLSLDRLAQEVNYSEYYICRIFKKVTKYTLTNYIVEKRIEKATHYLKGTLSIHKVAENVGFNNYSYFYKTFFKYMGFSPQEYRKRYQNSNETNSV
ncbi:AraC family transcriptional regulator [Luxibacter massiliensis]|uniref:AraC family transcriptional regulator n=1 Tax=Luxibacter massiliensis TaxID=2219695 RepID=UPI0013DFD151|nr:AraC family transcriptional regulator [Luxibacter massiliensis]